MKTSLTPLLFLVFKTKMSFQLLCFWDLSLSWFPSLWNGWCFMNSLIVGGGSPDPGPYSTAQTCDYVVTVPRCHSLLHTHSHAPTHARTNTLMRIHQQKNTHCMNIHTCYMHPYHTHSHTQTYISPTRHTSGLNGCGWLKRLIFMITCYERSIIFTLSVVSVSFKYNQSKDSIQVKSKTLVSILECFIGL